MDRVIHMNFHRRTIQSKALIVEQRFATDFSELLEFQKQKLFSILKSRLRFQSLPKSVNPNHE